ncbi:MAG: Rnf-Nqr domain containing protein [Ruminococcus sp.]|nr:Rnf-Nqr domain containing protein [Ruminococcus sp.]
MFLVTELVTLLATNLILTQALGTSTLFIAAGSKKNLLWTAMTITVFTSVGSGAAYTVNRILPDSLADLTLLFYTLIIGAIYVIFLAVLYYTDFASFATARKYVHISAFNCAVMGTLFTITDRAAAYPELNTFVRFVLSGAEAGTGFILAAFILTAAYRKLNSAKVPASFRGFPAMLVYLGLISMAVYALR